MLRKLHHIILLPILAISFTKNTFSQQYQEGNFGVNIGIVLGIGTHIDRFGGSVNAFYKTAHIQINPEFRVYFNAKNLGPKKSYIESVFSLGVVYGYGKKDSVNNDFYSSTSNQTQRKNSVGYAYNFYLNDIETSQRTGTISIQVNSFSFITENDIFAHPKFDRFRTGAFVIQYQKNKYSYSLNATLFTGEMGHHVTDENYPFNHVYENTIDGKYTEFSHGLLSAQFKYAGNYFQTYQANIGSDSERIRHAIQNRFVHDIATMPKISGHINGHIPMLDNKGEQYLFKEGQKVKPMRFYMNFFSNPATFY